jgi:NAD(P)-dependent dehydrogenase (short-subunit alcohol dehydrogenase family)
MTKPICLITGATDGLGKATAAELGARGYTVVLAARLARADLSPHWFRRPEKPST